MQQDIRQTPLYKEVAATFAAIFQPGSGRFSDADGLAASPDGQQLAFTGTRFNDLESAPHTRVCVLDRRTSKSLCLPHGLNSDRQPSWSPDGKRLAFLSDREEAGNFQLIIASGDGFADLISAPAVEGCIEALSWSPDGSKILLGVAGFGADLAGCQGGATVARKVEELPAWMPEVDTGDADNLWRSAWVYQPDNGTVAHVSPVGINVWESVWLGNDALLAVVSNSHSEGSWYQSKLVRIALQDQSVTPLFQPREQIGLPVANPSGTCAAIVEAVCSDRLIVAGDLKWVDPVSGTVTPVDTAGVDVTHLAWRDDHKLVFSGLRGFETVVGELDVEQGSVRQLWSADRRSIGAWYPAVAPLADGGVAAWVEAYDQAPQLTVMADGAETLLLSLENPQGEAALPRSGRAEPFSWMADDGREIQGWLIRPVNQFGPAPLVVDIHGGPVWACRNRWMGRLRGAKTLTDKGFVTLYPNPRGSSGQGQEFAALVRGDMGGEDTHDYLAGIDALVDQGIADPMRVGVTGISYGGFMSSWLITQDDRFAAAVPISPVTNWYSQHRTSQIPYFDEYFLEGSASESGGKFFQRSPVMFAHRVRCPTLILTGAKDQNTPPTQALEFHRSLLENGVKSALVTYPTAGHGIRTFPEVIDHTSRYVGWFLEHL